MSTEEESGSVIEDFPPFQMLRMITGAWVSQALYVVARLGVAEHLSDKTPKDIQELAVTVKAEPQALYRILRLLASYGVFREITEKGFIMTPLGECLQKDSFTSVRSFALLCGEEHYRAWGNLWESVQTGKTAFEPIFGTNVWDYLSQNPDAGAVFDDAMTSLAALGYGAIMSAYEFSSYRNIVDVGGGEGMLLNAVLNNAPEAKGILLETPEVIQRAKTYLEEAGVLERCTLIGGDFFQEIPEGGDVYVLSRILQNYTDTQCKAILQNCHRAAKKGAKILILEMVIPEGNSPFFGKLSDVNMLVMTGGKERTLAEYKRLLEEEGFSLEKEVKTFSPISILEGTRLS